MLGLKPEAPLFNYPFLRFLAAIYLWPFGNPLLSRNLSFHVQTVSWSSPSWSLFFCHSSSLFFLLPLCCQPSVSFCFSFGGGGLWGKWQYFSSSFFSRCHHRLISQWVKLLMYLYSTTIRLMNWEHPPTSLPSPLHPSPLVADVFFFSGDEVVFSVWTQGRHYYFYLCMYVLYCTT